MEMQLCAYELHYGLTKIVTTKEKFYFGQMTSFYKPLDIFVMLKQCIFDCDIFLDRFETKRHSKCDETQLKRGPVYTVQSVVDG